MRPSTACTAGKRRGRAPGIPLGQRGAGDRALPLRRVIGPGGRACPVLLLLALAGAGCDAPGERPPTRAALLRELAAADSAAAARPPTLSGVSARWSPDVRPLSLGALRGDTLSAGFETLRRRCAGCHAVPDPRLHTAEEWPSVVARMRVYADSAGLLPLTAEQRELITDFLRSHARR